MTPKRLIFSNPSSSWRYSALIGRFNLKQCLWAQCYFVYSVTMETAPKVPPSGKELICIFIQTNEKRATSGRGIC